MIGIWAGSSPSTRQEVDAGFARLAELGLPYVVPGATRRHMIKPESKTRHFLAGPDARKLEAFVELWQDERVTDIFCLRGGYGTLRLLPHLDRLNLKGHKRLWGYSDVTVIQNYLYQRLGNPWVHSPMMTSGGFAKPEASEKKAWQKALAGERTPPSEITLRVLHAPSSAARPLKGLPLIGGNLTSFVSLAGTPWMPRPDKPFFYFFEDINEPPYKIDRLLQQLVHGGGLKNCRGVILGHFTQCPKAHALFKLWASEHKVLTLSGVKAGHERPNLPLAMGEPVTLTLKNPTRAGLSLPSPYFNVTLKGR